MMLRKPALILAGAILLITAAVPGGVTRAFDSKKPISKNGLMEAVKLNGLTTEELIERVEERGVNFQLSADDEREFSQAGARPELIDAIRKNYRPERTEPVKPVHPGGGQPERFNVPPGGPLSQNEIITMLQSGVASARVEQFVEVRGVSFRLTPVITNEIKRAGGNSSLIGVIAERSMAESSSPPPRPVHPEPSGPDYDQLTEQATTAMTQRNFVYAQQLLNQAIKLEPNRPAAYALYEYAQLYGGGNIELAERAARAAIERGGNAVFRVYHDHSGNFNSYCTGSFFISKRGVTFKADDGVHTFEALRPSIKEAKLNGFVGSQYGAFHLKVAEAGGTKNYNFAPATRSKPEANLITSLATAQW